MLQKPVEFSLYTQLTLPVFSSLVLCLSSFSACWCFEANLRCVVYVAQAEDLLSLVGLYRFPLLVWFPVQLGLGSFLNLL